MIFYKNGVKGEIVIFKVFKIHNPRFMNGAGFEVLEEGINSFFITEIPLKQFGVRDFVLSNLLLFLFQLLMW